MITRRSLSHRPRPAPGPSCGVVTAVLAAAMDRWSTANCLSLTWATTPARSSSTRWSRNADTSMNLQPRLLANRFPSNTMHIRQPTIRRKRTKPRVRKLHTYITLNFYLSLFFDLKPSITLETKNNSTIIVTLKYDVEFSPLDLKAGLCFARWTKMFTVELKLLSFAFKSYLRQTRNGQNNRRTDNSYNA